MKVDKVTIEWLRDEARSESDETLVRACDGALEGDARSVATVEETLKHRVGRAHERHRRYAIAP